VGGGGWGGVNNFESLCIIYDIAMIILSPLIVLTEITNVSIPIFVMQLLG